MSGRGERREELGGGVAALVNDNFSFGEDALLLAEFSLCCARGAKRAADLGTGCGVIPLLWARERPGLRIDAVELQKEGASLAEKAAGENGFSARITVWQADLRTTPLPKNVYDLIACNPPYFRFGAGQPPDSAARRLARAEESLTLPELCAAAAGLLKNGRRFCLCHRTERMASVMHGLCGAGLTPKALQLVRTSPQREPKLFLLCAVRGGGEGLTMLPERLLCGTSSTNRVDCKNCADGTD